MSPVIIGPPGLAVNVTGSIRRSTLLAAVAGRVDHRPVITPRRTLMRIAFRVATLAVLLVAALGVAPVHAQDRSKTKEIVVGLGAEPDHDLFRLAAVLGVDGGDPECRDEQHGERGDAERDPHECPPRRDDRAMFDAPGDNGQQCTTAWYPNRGVDEHRVR